MKPAHEVEFTQFVNASSARLTHLAWLLCGDEHRAHDLVQEALERVCMRWSRLRTEQPHASRDGSSSTCIRTSGGADAVSW